MMLTNIRNKLATQNWTSVVTELVLLIIGIYLGLQADTWIKNQAEREHQLDFLEQAYQEIEQTLGFWENAAEQRERANLESEVLLDALDLGSLEGRDKEAFENALKMMYGISIVKSTLLHSQIKSGVLINFQDDLDVLTMLSRYNQVRQASMDISEKSDAGAFNLRPILSRHLSVRGQIDKDNQYSTTKVYYDFDEMIQDQQFVHALRTNMDYMYQQRWVLQNSYLEMLSIRDDLADYLKKNGRLISGSN